MPVKINSTGGGSVTLSSGSIATDVTATFPATTGNAVVDTAVQTLTNKTLVGAVMTSIASSVLTLGTAQASTSGTSIDFTGIPSWVRRVTVMLSGVSTNGTSNGLIQLGTSGGVVATGYAGAGAFGPAYSVSNYTTGFGMPIFSAAVCVIEGAVTITNLTGNTWVAAGAMSRSDAAISGTTAGRIALAGVLDRIRITTVGGTDTFDAGSINIVWE